MFRHNVRCYLGDSFVSHSVFPYCYDAINCVLIAHYDTIYGADIVIGFFLSQYLICSISAHLSDVFLAASASYDRKHVGVCQRSLGHTWLMRTSCGMRIWLSRGQMICWFYLIFTLWTNRKDQPYNRSALRLRSNDNIKDVSWREELGGIIQMWVLGQSLWRCPWCWYTNFYCTGAIHGANILTTTGLSHYSSPYDLTKRPSFIYHKGFIFDFGCSYPWCWHTNCDRRTSLRCPWY